MKLQIVSHAVEHHALHQSAFAWTCKEGGQLQEENAVVCLAPPLQEKFTILRSRHIDKKSQGGFLQRSRTVILRTSKRWYPGRSPWNLNLLGPQDLSVKTSRAHIDPTQRCAAVHIASPKTGCLGRSSWALQAMRQCITPQKAVQRLEILRGDCCGAD